MSPRWALHKPSPPRRSIQPSMAPPVGWRCGSGSWLCPAGSRSPTGRWLFSPEQCGEHQGMGVVLLLPKTSKEAWSRWEPGCTCQPPPWSPLPHFKWVGSKMELVHEERAAVCKAASHEYLRARREGQGRRLHAPGAGKLSRWKRKHSFVNLRLKLWQWWEAQTAHFS